MELASVQALLARLYTDQAFREAFLDAPELASRPYHLKKSDVEKMVELAAGPALLFSEALIRKRFGQVVSFLPATRRIMRKQMWEAFLGFAGHYNPKGVGRHLFDAIEFTGFLLKDYRSLIDAPGWWKLVSKYERTGLRALAAPFFFKIEFFRHDILRLYKSAGKPENEYIGAPQLVVWCKLTPGSKVWNRHFYPKYWPGSDSL